MIPFIDYFSLIHFSKESGSTDSPFSTETDLPTVDELFKLFAKILGSISRRHYRKDKIENGENKQ